MTAKEFKQAWEIGDDALAPYDAQTVNGLCLNPQDKALLIDVGLPSSAAPFLDFATPSTRFLPSVCDAWNAGDDFRRYRMIGNNGFGDPVCIDEARSGEVVYLNHDDAMKRCFMNTNVRCLAQSLLAFRDVVRASQAANGADAFVKNQIPDAVVNDFVSRMDSIDPRAIQLDTFWFRSISGEGI